MLTQKRLKEVLHYNPKTGIFTWINPLTRNYNMKNKPLYKNNKSEITGINWAEANKKWRASIGHLGKKYYLVIFLISQKQ